MKKLGVSLLGGILWGLMPNLALASGGHAKGSGALTKSLGSSSQTMIFLAILGNIIVLSMVGAEIIRTRRELTKGGKE